MFTVFEIFSLPFAIIHHFWKLEINSALLSPGLEGLKELLFSQTELFLLQNKVCARVLEIQHEHFIGHALRSGCLLLIEMRISCVVMITRKTKNSLELRGRQILIWRNACSS
jgi:hypothetical protein